MKRGVALFGLVLTLLVMFTVNQAGLLSAADAGTGSSYIGVSKCKMCHKGEKKAFGKRKVIADGCVNNGVNGGFVPQFYHSVCQKIQGNQKSGI